MRALITPVRSLPCVQWMRMGWWCGSATSFRARHISFLLFSNINYERGRRGMGALSICTIGYCNYARMDKHLANCTYRRWCTFYLRRYIIVLSLSLSESISFSPSIWLFCIQTHACTPHLTHKVRWEQWYQRQGSPYDLVGSSLDSTLSAWAPTQTLVAT